MRGEPSGDFPGFVNFLQNHDQIGNRAFGDRLGARRDAEAIEAALAITLLAPAVPMLFMGEEWARRRRFRFSANSRATWPKPCAGTPQRVRRAYAKYGDEIPDPLDAATFRSAVLDWDARESRAGRERLTLVQELLAIRRREIVPGLRARPSARRRRRTTAC